MLRSQSVLVVDHEVDQCVAAGADLVERREGEGALAIEGEGIQEAVQGEGASVLVGVEAVIPTSPDHSVDEGHSWQAWCSGEVFFLERDKIPRKCVLAWTQ